MFGNKHKEKLIFLLYSNAFNLLKFSMIPYQRFKITPRLGDIFHYRIFEIQKNIFVSGHREVICKKLISSYGLDIFFIFIYSVGIKIIRRLIQI